MKKLLYADLPFVGERSGAMNRSRFIWSALAPAYQVDFLIIQRWDNVNFKYKLPKNYHQHFTIKTSKPASLQPETMYQFSRKELFKFRSILFENNYDVIFIRFAAPSLLAMQVYKVLPNAKIVIDIDMVSSRLAYLSWKTNPTLKNRFFYTEHKRLFPVEKKLFNQPYLFLFTNYVEEALVKKKYVKQKSTGILKILPNVMHLNNYPIPQKKKNYILFFGALDSEANKDAFKFISQDIYPLIHYKLIEKKIKLRIVGNNQQPLYQEIVQKQKLDMIDLVGEVDDIDKEIAESQFVILPIRIASGTRTRILEAANLQTAVISNKIGAEGFEFGQDEIIMREKPKSLAAEIIKLLNDPEQCKRLGKKLLKRSHQLYLDSVVAEKLIREIEEFGE